MVAVFLFVLKVFLKQFIGKKVFLKQNSLILRNIFNRLPTIFRYFPIPWALFEIFVVCKIEKCKCYARTVSFVELDNLNIGDGRMPIEAYPK